jgi:site-specific DNA-methyltransferase (adenine-specific)
MSDALQWSGWTWRGCAVWDKKNSRPQRGRFRQQAEFMLWGSNGNLDTKRNVPVLPGVYTYSNPSGSKKIHQTQKPLELMQRIIHFCEPNGLILDPFMGSGTTIHAAALEDYRSVGIEKTDAYYAIAKERLKTHIPDNVFNPHA